MAMLAATVVVMLSMFVMAQPARAQVTALAQASILDNSALNWAESQQGKPYEWGGTGPYGFDCSGLVYAAFGREGIALPRTTYAMLGSPLLIQVPLDQVQRGDLLFFGPGHVEFATVWHDISFGALDYGTVIGWHQWYPGSWYPTMAFAVG